MSDLQPPAQQHLGLTRLWQTTVFLCACIGLSSAVQAAPAESPESIPPVVSAEHAETGIDAAALIDQALERTRGQSSYAEMSMRVHRPKWERNSSLRAWTRGTADALIRFTAPAKDAGNGTLRKGPQMWTFTPKLNRVVRLPASLMAQSWGGSDFSYNDLSRSDELRTHFTHKISATEADAGLPVYVVTSTPKADAPVVWGQQELKIRADFVVLEQTFFDQDLIPLKRMTASDIKDVGKGRIIATRLRMSSLEEADHWTEINYDEINFDIQVEDRKFTQFSLKNPE